MRMAGRLHSRISNRSASRITGTRPNATARPGCWVGAPDERGRPSWRRSGAVEREAEIAVRRALHPRLRSLEMNGVDRVGDGEVGGALEEEAQLGLAQAVPEL